MAISKIVKVIIRSLDIEDIPLKIKVWFWNFDFQRAIYCRLRGCKQIIESYLMTRSPRPASTKEKASGSEIPTRTGSP